MSTPATPPGGGGSGNGGRGGGRGGRGSGRGSGRGGGRGGANTPRSSGGAKSRGPPATPTTPNGGAAAGSPATPGSSGTPGHQPSQVLEVRIRVTHVPPDKDFAFGHLQDAADAVKLEVRPTADVIMFLDRVKTCGANVHSRDIVLARVSRSRKPGKEDSLFVHEGVLMECPSLDTAGFADQVLERVCDDSHRLVGDILACPAPLLRVLQSCIDGDVQLLLSIAQIMAALPWENESEGSRTKLFASFDQVQFWSKVVELLPRIPAWRRHSEQLQQMLTIGIKYSSSKQVLLAAVAFAKKLATGMSATAVQDGFEFSLLAIDAAASRILALSECLGIGAAFTDTTSLTALKAPRTEVMLLPTSAEMSIPATQWAHILSSMVLPAGSPYPTTDAYLDAQHHVLRAEAFADLCGAIRAIRNNQDVERGISVYYEVHAQEMLLQGFAGHLVLAFLMQEQARKYSWDTGSRLMVGNLLALLMRVDGREEVAWAIVTHRDPQLLKKGLVGVQFYSEYNVSLTEQQIAMWLTNPSISVTMIESPVYFHAIAPAINRLKHLTDETLPFADELVRMTPSVDATRLRPVSTSVDVSCLFKSQTSRAEVSLERLQELLKVSGATICDDSQSAAIRGAINSKVALIQGPPGTGKTFVAKLLVRLLMSMPPEALGGPILVMAYKNHALDQFVKGLFPEFETHMVRLGGAVDATTPSGKIHLHTLTRNADDRRSSEFYDLRSRAREHEDTLKHFGQALRDTPALSLEIFLEQATNDQIRSLLENSLQQAHTADPEGYTVVAGGKRRHKADTTTLTVEQVEELLTRLEEALQLPTKPKLVDAVMEDSVLAAELRLQFGAWCPPLADMKRVTAEREVMLEDTEGDDAEAGDSKGQDSTDGQGDDNIDNRERILNATAALPALPTAADKGVPAQTVIRLVPDKPDDLAVRRLRESSPPGNPDVFRLTPVGRAALAVEMLQRHVAQSRSKFFQEWQEYRELQDEVKRMRANKAMEIVSTRRIMFMTVSGACLNTHLLNSAKPAVVIVEEAAEVMESVLLGALPASVKQLIMIGDHKQLRPTTNCHELTLQCQADVSLFERLFGSPGVFSCRLLHQARMPDVLADFVRIPNLYSEYYTRHELVARNEQIECLPKPMYFVDTHDQEAASSGMSKRNAGEAAYLLKCLQQMLLLGVAPTRISILAAYAGQVSTIRQLLKARIPACNTIRVCTVDQFQGDENDLILVSLVRSDALGYLSIQNRMCVALTRARCAVVVFGNHELLCKAAHWRHALDVFIRNDAFVEELPFTCPRHRHGEISLSKDPNSPVVAVCDIDCGAVMSCGHACPSKCHHGQHGLCRAACPTVMACGHKCANKCHTNRADAHKCTQACGQTMACGHVCKSQCHRSSPHPNCMVACTRNGACGHPCTKRCSETCINAANCPVCLKAEELERLQQLARQQQIIATACAAIDERIADLQDAKADAAGAQLEPLDPSTQEYLDVMEQVSSSVLPVHNFSLRITDIVRIVNPALELKCVQARRAMFAPHLPSCRKFHGTKSDRAQVIAQNGFKLPDKAGMYGKGIYFATNSSKSAQGIYTDDTLLLCDVWLGSQKRVTCQDNTLHERKKRDEEQYDSVFAPRDTKSTGGVLNDEFVVFNEFQALPLYLIKFSRAASAPTTAPATAFQIIKIDRDAFPPNSLEDTQFRIAESQYLRMTASWGAGRPEVRVVEWIRNPVLDRVYETTRAWMERHSIPTKEEFMFHGTPEGNISKIAEHGFKVGGRDGHPVAVGTALGTGVYTAAQPDVSARYAAGVRKMFLVKVLPGLPGAHQPPTAPRLQPAAQHYRQGDVLVLYNAEQVLPMYIVHY